MTSPYPPQPRNPHPPQQVQYNLGTAKLNKKFGVLGTWTVGIVGVVLVGGAIWSLAAQTIVPIGLAVAAALLAILRRFLLPNRTGVIDKRAMGSITIGTQGIAIANVEGKANVFSWQEIEAIGVLRWKENIVFRSVSPRIAQALRPMKPGVPVYLPISILYIEAPREEVVAALRHYAGGRFAGVDLDKDALTAARPSAAPNRF
ncbi:hypothetical protein [Amycolatopsis taiwanensis]|uniref:hypothetical protein n=1 Tax=Amycolatopsis taiwanensis TaxID=342230 RepID=UPI0004822F55|nr:hypothetical protein [Amycolatopsis taiwanensis]